MQKTKQAKFSQGGAHIAEQSAAARAYSVFSHRAAAVDNYVFPTADRRCTTFKAPTVSDKAHKSDTMVLTAKAVSANFWYSFGHENTSHSQSRYR